MKVSLTNIFLVSIPQAVSTVATSVDLFALAVSSLKVSIPQAVSTVATQLALMMKKENM